MLCLQDRHSFFFASPLPSTLVGKDSQPGRLGDLLGMERIQSWPSASGGAAVAPRKVKERNGSVFPEVRRVPPNSIKMNEPESRQCKLVLPGSSDEEVVVPRASEAGDVLPAAAGGGTPSGASASSPSLPSPQPSLPSPHQQPEDTPQSMSECRPAPEATQSSPLVT
jgi:hypothetical protein